MLLKSSSLFFFVFLWLLSEVEYFPMFSACCISSFVNRIFVVHVFLVFLSPSKPLPVVQKREHAGRARSNDSRAVNQFYWPSVADIQSSTCRDPSYLLETSGLCIQCFKLNSSSCLLWYWAYSSEQSRWKSFKN